MRKQKTPALVNLAIYTTITVFLWIFFDIYRSLKKVPLLDIDTKILDPINPNLDNNLLNEIKTRIFYNESEYNNLSIPVEDTNQISKQSTKSGNLNR
jgi:hypothetical protein